MPNGTLYSQPAATSNIWDMQANEQSYKALVLSALNSTALPTNYDPIYGKLVEQISDTVYHKMRVEQVWSAIGSTHAPQAYPGILREIAMTRRKGQDFAMDVNPRPTTFGEYPIIGDDIQVRYHAAQFRWMYGYTIFDEELRRFSGGNGTTVGQLTEMKAINMASARNMYMDALRKKTMNIYATQVAGQVSSGVDISDFDNLTEEQAKSWLNEVDNLIFQLWVGTNLYNGLNAFMQTPKDRLQVIMPRKYWNNIVRRAFPDTFHGEYFQNIMPENMILVDTMGDDHVFTGDPATQVEPTFDSQGMNLLNWSKSSNVKNASNIQCLIVDKFAIGFEDNLNETLMTPKDARKLVTNVYNHFWTKAYVTDMVAGLAVTT